ncbi:Uncharacterized protein BP5553_09271 [Venustampulla echinocandica]|uniref:Uncharacterized protein n=1 Tax=Venustampulla echinocandica TaxID=2656787 RepID=A0A370TC85_9HELO|nr:Uncharacterized protein BP5553_09271 [Venustampulla echinocandica]RDL31869.1 Uncharacterized protein BP5553_09271 [Venustampulla echinocandica]
MASVNGILGPPSHMEPANDSITLSAKRKRDESEGDHQINSGIASQTSQTSQPTGASTEETQSLIRDLVDVLKSHDTVPSILTRPLPDRASSSEPQAKRQKAEDVSETQNTIVTRVASNTYKDLDDVLEDIDTAVSDILEKLELPNGAARNQYIPPAGPQAEIALKASAFKRRAHELVRREKASSEQNNTSKPSVINNSSYTSNNNVGVNPYTQINAGLGDNKMVLTLYGNAPGPKQLFSSFQIPTEVDGEKNAVQPLREAGLPTGISTTQIIPIKSSSLVEGSKRVTLGDVFPTPANVPGLQPPKPSKNATTRSSTVGWYQPTAVDALPKTGSYFKAPISCGQWLDYSQVTSPQDSKKRHRDRAMSLVGAKAPLPDAEPLESTGAKLEALFRSAYSSFAPTKDNSAAVAPTGVLDRIWWQQAGERSFERLVENTNNLDTATTPGLDTKHEVEDDEEMKEFEQLVETWNGDIVDPNLAPVEANAEKSVEEKDVEEVLEGISELLETLNSYQRIRNMTLNPATRPAGLLSAPDSSSLGTPSKPSEAEQATYEILKSQLALMISTLPPYAVAKLDPDRLADLRISTKIEIRLDDYRGVMEEDEAAAKARAAAAASTTSSSRAIPPSVHRSSSALYGNQYSSSRPAPTLPHQYYGAQTPARASPNMQRPTPTAAVPYPAQRAASAAPYRPSAYGTPTYGHQAARPVPQQYQPSSSAQYLQTPGAQSYMRPNQGYQGIPQATPQASINGRYASQPPYSQQPQNGHDYRYANSSNIARQSSPQKPLYSPQPSAPQPRPSYSTPTPGISQDRRPFLPTSMINGSAQPTNQAQYTPLPATSLTNYSTFMTQEQQSSMMERQRAQLAAQQQSAQQQARNAAQAALGSPSKTPVNGNSAVAAGL